MKVWITKFALTRGVLECETVAGWKAEEDGSCTVVSENSWHNSEHFYGNDWHLNKCDAIHRVKKMIDAKRKSIKKQLDKLAAFEARLDRGLLTQRDEK
jgi:hypothetical protein